MESPVQIFAKRVWGLRAGHQLREHLVRDLDRELYTAACREMAGNDRYDPEIDARISWARQVLTAVRAGVVEHQLADSDTEALVEVLLGL